MIREELAARETQLEALRDENVKLRAAEEDLTQTKRELAMLSEQARVLRAQAFVDNRAPHDRGLRRRRSRRPGVRFR
jgi:hypothetical protein